MSSVPSVGCASSDVCCSTNPPSNVETRRFLYLGVPTLATSPTIAAAKSGTEMLFIAPFFDSFQMLEMDQTVKYWIYWIYLILVYHLKILVN